MSDQLAPEVLSMLKVALAADSSAFRKISSLSAKKILDAPLSPSAPFLSQEERHLLTHHREEVGRLLYEGCMLTLQGPVEETKTILMRDVTDAARWRRECRRVLDSREPSWPREREALSSTNGREGLGSSAAKLALALHPTDDARWAYSELLRLEGQFKRSETVASEITQHSRSRTHRSSAYTVLGACYHARGEHHSSLQSYSSACASEQDNPIGLIYCFVQAAILGDASALRSAAERIRAREAELRLVLRPVLRILRTERPATDSATAREFALLQETPGKWAWNDIERRILDAL